MYILTTTMKIGKTSICVLLIWMIICINTCKSESEDNVKVYTKEEFSSQLGLNNLFVMFFAPWCSHCETLHPVWSDLATDYNTKFRSDLIIGKVDCTIQTELCSSQDITGYPTLKLYKIGENEGKKFKGSRDITSLKKFIHSEIEVIDEEEDTLVNVYDSSDLIELNETTFLDYISVGTHFVKLYAPWCSHCQDLAQTWYDLAKSLREKDVTVSKIDCTTNKNICSALDVVSYPTLLWMQDGKKVGTYQGSRSLDDLLKYSSNMLKPTASLRNAEQLSKSSLELEKMVLPLYEDNFSSETNRGITFVKFFAPWCGHCKRLAPTWEELAKRLSGEGNIKIANVDCTLEENKELCNEQKVNGYPTLVLYRNGMQISEYNGSRELEDLLKFVKQHTLHDEL